MKDNGTDRDIAQAFVSVVNDLATLLGTLNDNLFVPHIVTQPTNQTAAVGSNAVFTVVANNVVEYKWQYRLSGSTNWRDINPGEITGIDTATLTVPHPHGTLIPIHAEWLARMEVQYGRILFKFWNRNRNRKVNGGESNGP